MISRMRCGSLPLILYLAVSCTDRTEPRVSLSASTIEPGETVVVQGSGFSPNKSVESHVRRPDQTEYEVLRFVADNGGEYSHSILTPLFMPGTYEVWALDEESQLRSNVAKLEVRWKDSGASSP